MRPRAALYGVLATALLAAAGCSFSPPVAVGNKAPEFAANTLDGEAVSLAELRGEVVLLNVWATWCFPCRREMPSFEALHRELGGEGLRVVAVSIDQPGAASEIRAFLEEYDITFTVLYDSEQRITRAFNTLGVPETFLIDRNGVLVKHWIGRIDGRSPLVRAPIHDALGPYVAAR
jgi:cytochrome c biogenesis protein CcmG, thiol:disulfide interchange protein DsbE